MQLDHFKKTTFGALLAFACALGHAAPAPTKIYFGLFGGTSSSNNFNVNQYGTAFFPEISGGPLAVNGSSTLNGGNAGLFGAKLGFQWAEIAINSLNAVWGLAPAIEVEGYSMGSNTFSTRLNNNTARIEEHVFVVNYPTKINVFLTDAIINLNAERLGRFHPYLGVGFGGAIARITNATSVQVSPAELGVNHYNSNPNDTETTFAAQTKLGLNIDLYQNLSMFVEYRWLYLSSTSYTFGSTVYPAHVPTSSWQVNMDPQKYNIGTVGLQLSI